MTKQFEELKDQPQTGIHVTELRLEERSQVRRVTLQSGPGQSRPTMIYYLSGDEKRAAEVFVAENEDVIQEIDFSKRRNKVKSNVDREIYDWILHTVGERRLQKFESVVIEVRSNGAVWVIDRETYDKGSSRRYAIGDHTGARIQDETLQSIYQQFKEVITESDLRSLDAIDGAAEYILKAYRESPEFDCEPITVAGELAIQKSH